MNILPKRAGLGAALALVAAPVIAESHVAPDVPAHTVYILNSLLFLIGGFLVMWMAAGFCMLEAGLVRSKNVSMQLTKNMGLFSLAAVFYYLVGYQLMYPGDGWTIDGMLGAFASASLLSLIHI